MHELMPSFLRFPFIVVRLTVTYRGLCASEYLFSPPFKRNTEALCRAQTFFFSSRYSKDVNHFSKCLFWLLLGAHLACNYHTKNRPKT